VCNGVGRDDHAGEVQAGQQRLELGDLVGGGGHVALGEHGPVVVVQRCQQVHLVAVTGRAAQRLAVHCEHATVAWRAQPVSQPRADGGIHRVAVDPCEHPADGGLAGDVAAAGERVTAHPERGQDRPGRVGSLFGDCGHRPGAGQHRRGADAKHAGQGVPSTPAVAWVGQHRQPLQQAGQSPTASGRACSGSVTAAGMGDDRAAGTGVRQVMRR